jgi:hypothetical protein
VAVEVHNKTEENEFREDASSGYAKDYIPYDS